MQGHELAAIVAGGVHRLHHGIAVAGAVPLVTLLYDAHGVSFTFPQHIVVHQMQRMSPCRRVLVVIVRGTWAEMEFIVNKAINKNIDLCIIWLL